MARAEQQWQRRQAPAALAEAIAIWETVAAERADEADVHLKLARAHLWHGRSLTGERALAAFQRGTRAATRAAARSASEAQRLDAAYWLLANRVAAAGAGGYVEQVDGFQALFASAQKLTEQGGQTDSGGPRRILASLLCSPPLFALRDLKTAESLYRALIDAHPAHLPNHLEFARQYAVAAQDLPLFKRELQHVLAAPGNSPTDALAKASAQRLLELAPHLFE